MSPFPTLPVPYLHRSCYASSGHCCWGATATFCRYVSHHQASLLMCVTLPPFGLHQLRNIPRWWAECPRGVYCLRYTAEPTPPHGTPLHSYREKATRPRATGGAVATRHAAQHACSPAPCCTRCGGDALVREGVQEAPQAEDLVARQVYPYPGYWIAHHRLPLAEREHRPLVPGPVPRTVPAFLCAPPMGLPL